MISTNGMCINCLSFVFSFDETFGHANKFSFNPSRLVNELKTFPSVSAPASVISLHLQSTKLISFRVWIFDNAAENFSIPESVKWWQDDKSKERHLRFGSVSKAAERLFKPVSVILLQHWKSRRRCWSFFIWVNEWLKLSIPVSVMDLHHEK